MSLYTTLPRHCPKNSHTFYLLVEKTTAGLACYSTGVKTEGPQIR